MVKSRFAEIEAKAESRYKEVLRAAQELQRDVFSALAPMQVSTRAQFHELTANTRNSVQCLRTSLDIFQQRLLEIELKGLFDRN